RPLTAHGRPAATPAPATPVATAGCTGAGGLRGALWMARRVGRQHRGSETMAERTGRRGVPPQAASGGKRARVLAALLCGAAVLLPAGGGSWAQGVTDAHPFAMRSIDTISVRITNPTGDP